MINYIIVDDEPLAHEIIEEFCGMLPNLSLKTNCYNAIEAMEYLKTEEVDLIFLDLNMPKLKGFDFLKTLSNPPQIIVTTAYSEYALDGFELNVLDYLLKPFSFERFIKAVNKVSDNVLPPKTTSKVIVENKESHFFFIKGDKKHHRINTNDVLFVEAYGNYSKIYTISNEVIICHEKISSFDEILPEPNFIRVHKSFIISLDKIKTIEGNRVKLIGEHTVPIGQTYKNQITLLIHNKN
ncbi:DNA-binding response regulator, LytR/AlgR family [Tenacibaculum sp. MAR_2009_124]|uniref:LytR/AlgR family response regulator transcription factor n=1 Tax=Tenacibaculum sp. MAR_2009_124 TaxID=1250059 RepID=UPI00089561CC|nr:LytTR family DNA-binding domain-containing protein [Tenacibaculum sp. MAR_2009_124]SEB45070.1 DNA-binding response regulator, LytR/AlgR family [Tenacibaculum sp. MAR_2009_124]